MLTKHHIALTTILVTSSFLFLTKLGSNSLADWDEAWYADASRFMFENDHFLTPIWNNQYFFDKPPLQYWLTQPFLYFFGETELAYRLPSALAAIALVLIIYRWGGFPAAAILLSFPHFLDRGRSGNFDVLFVFFTTLSMFLMVKNRPALGGIFLGLSWLTKGVFSGLFPVISLFAYYAVSKGPALRRKAGPLLIYVIAAAVIYFPWHLVEYSRFDHLINQSYFATFDQGEFGTANWMDIAWRFDLRYLVFLWTFLRWWFPILLIALIYQLMKFAKLLSTNAVSQTSNHTFRYLPLISFLIIFLALSAAKSKNDWYIMPAYPFIALMIPDLIHRVSSFALNKLAKLANLRVRLLPPASPRGESEATRAAARRRGLAPSDSEWVTANEQISANELTGAKLAIAIVLSISVLNIYLYRRQAFPPDKWLPQKQLGLTVKNLTDTSDLVVTAEYEFPTLRYYSERQVRTAARQPDYQGKYWWTWDNADIATALRHGQNIVTIHRPGAEWSVDVPGYHREEIAEINGRIISRFTLNSP